MRHTSDRSGLVIRRLLLSIAGVAIVAGGIGLAMSRYRLVGPRTNDATGGALSLLTDDDLPLPSAPVAIPVTDEMRMAAKANGQFAVDLYQRLASTGANDDLFLSPFSISTALTMTAEGAVEQTLDQMLTALHLPPGDMDQIHRGQQGLHRAVTPAVPLEVTERIRALRARLIEINKQTETLSAARNFKAAYLSAANGAKLAGRINTLVSRVAGYELQIANALWLEQSYPIAPSFVATVKPYYGAVLFPVDFKGQPEPARSQINDWVAHETNDRIRGLLGPGSVDTQTRLVLTNTVYFRGDWAEPFEVSMTQMKPFHRADDRSTDVSMMHKSYSNTARYGAFTATGDFFPTPTDIPIDMKDDDPSLYPDEDGLTMLAMNYQGQKLQMILIVPQSAKGLAKLEQSLSYDRLQEWIGQLKQRMVNLSVPKFKLEAKYELSTTLQSQGMVRPFAIPTADQTGAQFDKLSVPQSGAEPLFISDVIHQTFVDVSEIGTEAAAATGVVGAVGDFGPDEPPKTRPFIPIFKADKPFLFLIQDRDTATILFLGRYTGPRT